MSHIFWIIEYCATLSEWFLFLIFSGTFIENTDLKQSLLKSFIISNIGTVLMLFINSIELYSPLTVLCSFCIVSIISSIVHLNNKLKVSSLAVIFLLIINLIDNIVVHIIVYVTKISISEIYEKMSIYRVLAIIASKTLLLFFTVIINKLNKKQKAMPNKYLIALFTITSILLIISVSMTFMEMKNKKSNTIMLIVFFVIMLSLLLIIFFGFFKLAEYYENRQQLRLITLKNQMLEQSMTETEQTFMLWKTSLHDFKHNIMNLILMAENNDIQGIKQYLEKENDLLGKKLFYYKTGNDTVDIILNIKQKLAENKGITFIINAEVPEDCKITSMDFSSLLGNLLDNAIEAAEKEINPFIEVKIKSVKDYLIINILNKYTKSDVCPETTKNEKHLHGIGIHSVKHTVKKYDGEFYTEISDDIFNVKIMIPL